jgi:hypothetical protein
MVDFASIFPPLNYKSVTGLQEAIKLASMAGPSLRRWRPLG